MKTRRSEAPAEPDEIVWLRDLDGTGSMHPCTPRCAGAIRYIREDLSPFSPDLERLSGGERL